MVWALHGPEIKDRVSWRFKAWDSIYFADLKVEKVPWQGRRAASKHWQQPPTNSLEGNIEDLSPAATRNWILPLRMSMEAELSPDHWEEKSDWSTPWFQALQILIEETSHTMPGFSSTEPELTNSCYVCGNLLHSNRKLIQTITSMCYDKITINLEFCTNQKYISKIRANKHF